jgi:hypothetical protein
MHPRGRQPATATHTHDPRPVCGDLHPTSYPCPTLSVWGRGMCCGSRLAGAGGESAPGEGHDFARLRGGGACRILGWGPAHVEGTQCSGEREGAFLKDREPATAARPKPCTAPRYCGAEPPSPCPCPRRTRGGDQSSHSRPPYLWLQVYARGAPPNPRSCVGRGRAGSPLRPPARTLPSPGRLRSRRRRRRRRRCPLLQCESRRCRRAGPGPGRPGNRDSTWRGAARGRAHPLSRPPPRRGPAGAAPPRSGGGWWLRRRGHPICLPAAQDSGCSRREGG